MSHFLKNDFLQVQIAEPLESYNGSRFDHSGNITQVTFNGKHTFCTSEQTSHNSELGSGLANEFDIKHAQSFSQTPLGDNFHKIGVGSLKKKGDKPYDFFFPYENIPLEYEIQKSQSNKLVFITQSPVLKGIQYRYKKSITIEGSCLSIDYTLENLGNHTLKTEEYCHNFLSINGHPIGPEYELKADCKIQTDQFKNKVDPHHLLNVSENKISWSSIPQDEFYIEGVNGMDTEYRFWQLTHRNDGVGVMEKVNRTCTGFNLWGRTHVVCPELFVSLQIEPGQTETWQRKYTFFEV